MRNWNIKLNLNRAKVKSIYYLPMRNWNSEKASEKHRIFAFTIYLWGIETCKRQSQSTTWKKFTIYLWGIETFQKNPSFLRKKHIYYLPMRNWNFHHVHQFFAGLSNLLFTYEELKRVILNSEYSLLVYLLFTYEELKLSRDHRKEFR